MVRRGDQVRSALILRLFAIERFLRAIVFGAAAYVVWRFEYRRVSIEQAFDRELPAVRALFKQIGFDIDHSKLVGLISRALTLSNGSIQLLAGGLALYAVIELIEGTGLWLGKRWGEYFAMVATSIFLPYEIYDLTARVTVTRVVFFLINLALVLYLVLTKRLFGVRGGKRAYPGQVAQRVHHGRCAGPRGRRRARQHRGARRRCGRDLGGGLRADRRAARHRTARFSGTGRRAPPPASAEADPLADGRTPAPDQ